MTIITNNGASLARKLAPSLPAPARGNKAVAELCSLIARHTVTHGRLSTIVCNGGGDYPRNWPEALVTKRRRADIVSADKRTLEIEKLVTILCKRLSVVAECEIAPIFDGDPRGITVKLRVPDGRSDNWGGEGIDATG